MSKVLGRIGDVIYTVDDDGMVSRDGEVIGPVQEVLKFLGGYMEDVPEGKAPAAPAAQTAAPRPRRPDLPNVPGGDSMYLRLKGLWNDPGSGRFTPRGFSTAKAQAMLFAADGLVRDAAKSKGTVMARVADNRMSRAGINKGDVIEVVYKDDEFGRVQITGKNGKKRWYDVQWARFSEVVEDPTPVPDPEPTPEPPVVPDPVTEVMRVPNDPKAVRQAALDLLADVPDDPFAAPPKEKPKQKLKHGDLWDVAEEVAGKNWNDTMLSELATGLDKYDTPLSHNDRADFVYGLAASVLLGDGSSTRPLADEIVRSDSPFTEETAVTELARRMAISAAGDWEGTQAEKNTAMVQMVEQLSLSKSGKPTLLNDVLTAMVRRVKADYVNPNADRKPLFADATLPLEQNPDVFGTKAKSVPLMSVITQGDLEAAINHAFTVWSMDSFRGERADERMALTLNESVIDTLAGNMALAHRMGEMGLDAGSYSSRQRDLESLLRVFTGRGGKIVNNPPTPYGAILMLAIDQRRNPSKYGGPVDTDVELTDVDRKRLAKITDAGRVVLDYLRAEEETQVPGVDVADPVAARAAANEARAAAQTAIDKMRANRQLVADEWLSKKNAEGKFVGLTLTPDTSEDSNAILDRSDEYARLAADSLLEFTMVGSDGNRYLFTPRYTNDYKVKGWMIQKDVLVEGPEQGRRKYVGMFEGRSKKMLGWRADSDAVKEAVGENARSLRAAERAEDLTAFETTDDADGVLSSFVNQLTASDLSGVLDPSLLDESDRTRWASKDRPSAADIVSLALKWGTMSNAGQYGLRVEDDISFNGTDYDVVLDFQDAGRLRLSIRESGDVSYVFRAPLSALPNISEGDVASALKAVKYKNARVTVDRLESATLRDQRLAVRRKMAEQVLDGGDEVEILGSGKGLLHDVVREVSRLYPKRLLASRPPVRVRKKGGRRACYSSYGDQLQLVSGNKSTALHELGHHIERNPELSKMLWAFYVHRTGGQRTPLEGLGSLFPGWSYSVSEMTRSDEFFEAYAGKDYGSAARRSMSPSNGREIFTVGMEGVFFDHKGRKSKTDDKQYSIDDEHAAFILGSLLLSSRSPEDQGSGEVPSVRSSEVMGRLASIHSDRPLTNSDLAVHLTGSENGTRYVKKNGDWFTVAAMTQLIDEVASDPNVQRRVKEQLAEQNDFVFGLTAPNGRAGAVSVLYDAVIDKIADRYAVNRDTVMSDFRYEVPKAETIDPTIFQQLLAGTVDQISGKGTSVAVKELVARKMKMGDPTYQLSVGPLQPSLAKFDMQSGWDLARDIDTFAVTHPSAVSSATTPGNDLSVRAGWFYDRYVRDVADRYGVPVAVVLGVYPKWSADGDSPSPFMEVITEVVDGMTVGIATGDTGAAAVPAGGAL